MKLKMYQIDAFADKVFSGNPAAVCPLDEWLDDGLMQNIAIENNLSETAFFVPVGENFHLRCFTPGGEVKLCGHATLASAFVLFAILGYEKDAIKFNTLSGELQVAQKDGLLEMDFPAQMPELCAEPEGLAEALGKKPLEVYSNDDYFAVFKTEDDILSMTPNFEKLSKIKTRGVCVTAKGEGEIDFVSRFFAPRYGINEDPVTGSAHCGLTPLWAAKLSKTKLLARQTSKREGTLYCTLNGNRVTLAGKAVKFMEAVINV